MTKITKGIKKELELILKDPVDHSNIPIFSWRFIKKILIDPTDSVTIQVFRYLFTGGTAFLIDFGLLYFFTDVVGLYYLLSSIISFTAGTLITYFFSIFWVFNQRKLNSKIQEFIVFAIISVVGLLLTSFFLWLFTDVLHQHYLISKIIASIIVFFWNFVAKKSVLFTSKKPSN